MSEVFVVLVCVAWLSAELSFVPMSIVGGYLEGSRRALHPCHSPT